MRLSHRRKFIEQSLTKGSKKSRKLKMRETASKMNFKSFTKILIRSSDLKKQSLKESKKSMSTSAQVLLSLLKKRASSKKSTFLKEVFHM